jgi:hypothetical protein
MAATRDELEAALRVTWDHETLASYAELLRSEADPRGELIALDLRLEQHPEPELELRRDQQLAMFLGIELTDEIKRLYSGQPRTSSRRKDQSNRPSNFR